jgi:serine/threonine protein kinase KIN1/2
MREIDISSLLDHPNIVSMRDYVKTDYHWYLLFDYIDGGQMLDYIISHGRLKEKQARKFARQLTSAMRYCHAHKIVHRNIKMENILVSRTGDIKLVDFCFSSLWSPDEESVIRCGSAYFVAPEVMSRTPCFGPEVDVWSFGVVLYIMVCGKVPFDGKTMNEIRLKITTVAEEYPRWLSSGKFTSNCPKPSLIGKQSANLS